MKRHRLAMAGGTWVLLFVTTFALPNRVMAATPIVFEDSFDSLEKWESVRTTNGSWTLLNGSVEGLVMNPGTVIEMVPKDTYWNPDWHNIRYELDYTPLEGVDKNISFGFENLLNWYEIHFVETGYNLVRVQNGGVPFSINDAFTMENGKTYHLAITFNEGHIQISVDGTIIADKLDWTFNNNFGKIGIKAGTGAVAPTRVRFDNVTVSLLDPSPDTLLNVPGFKQTTTAWADDIYDSANQWAPQATTIRRWGCALSSLAMIFQYHGISKLPDGTPLNPGSLNAWLKSQPDGYIGEGALNWIAATRLSREIATVFNTPKLEYRSVLGNTIATAMTEISENKPSILQIPGHFLVAQGYTADKSDLRILDPAYTYTRFSQHEQPLLSTRLFQPSQTDLSYLLLVPSNPLALKFSGAARDSWQQSDERITTIGGEFSTATEWYQLAKPSNGEYQFTLPEITEPTELSLYSYDAAGNVKIYQQSFSPTDSNATWVISYDQGTSSIKQVTAYSFDDCIALLTNLRKQKRITTQFANLGIKLARYGQLTKSAKVKHTMAKVLATLFAHCNQLTCKATAKTELTAASQQLLTQYPKVPKIAIKAD